jgi:F-type H+-transporting ATPase subunit a
VYVANDPIHQFKISKIFDFSLGGLQLPFTNSALFMLAAVAVLSLVMSWGLKGQLVPGRLQSVSEMLYGMIRTTVVNVIGEEGLKFFPLVFTLFGFVLACNMLGMIPYFFTVTSHISVTLALGLMVFAIVVGVGVMKKGPIGFLKMFFPPGLPWFMYILITPIEMISFLIRPFTLGVRLFANMLAGHMMLKVFAGFVVSMLAAGGGVMLLSVFPLIGIIGVTALEFLVAFLQAYVFAVLTCIYLNDAVHDHHH